MVHPLLKLGNRHTLQDFEKAKGMTQDFGYFMKPNLNAGGVRDRNNLLVSHLENVDGCADQNSNNED